MDPVKAKANFSRICQLLIDKGGDALRRALHAKHPPSTLAAVLNANKTTLKKIRYSVIKPSQWELLFPISGTPDSNSFDITLLTILHRNICGLRSSISANITRIEILRNEIYGHIPSPHMHDIEFDRLWKEISAPLIKLGIPQQHIDELKESPLSPEEESYTEKLKEWKELEDSLLSKVLNVENELLELRRTVENVVPSQVDQLAKFDFTGKIDRHCKKFQDGTRKWLLDNLSSWFDDEESRVMTLTAGPGVGKSVLSAKVCEVFKQRGQLAGCHFCDFRNADSRNPHRILQSLASQMCDNVDGFRDKLTEVLRHKHSQDSLSDAFRVLLNDPLHALDKREPILIVVDALDESETDVKSEFLEFISDEFPELPEWIKIFITSRPELQVQTKPQHLNHVEILPDDHHHTLDLKYFILHCLPNLSEGNVSSLTSKCEGSFLYAYYLVNELEEMDVGIEPNLSDYDPKGISGFYEKQFKHFKIDNFVDVLPTFLANKYSQDSNDESKKSDHLYQQNSKSGNENLDNDVGLNALKSRSFTRLREPPAPILSLRLKELNEENVFLKNEIKSLQATCEGILAEFGKMAVQQSAKENEERRHELFQEIYQSPSSEATALPTNKHRSNKDMNGSLNKNGSLKTQTTNESTDTPSVIHPTTSTEQPVEGAEALVQQSNHQPVKENVVTSDKGESEIQRGDRLSTKVSTFKDSNENQIPSTQNTSSNTSREKTSGGDGINQSGKVQGTSDLASTSHQSFENLSLSVQQDDSGTEYISLGNVPPTSVATTLYNNYKLLLLSLSQRLLSCDVVKLKNWARENFSINDPQNTTDVFFQLDQKAVINASDLSQISHFFESIVRIDLVYIIDAFLLGDYSKLRQTSAPKQQAANAAQTSQYRSTTMYQSMFSAMNTGRQSFVNPAASGILQTNPRRNAATLRKPGNGNGSQRSVPQQTQLATFRNMSDTINPARFSRSPNETQSTAFQQQNLQPATTGFTPTRKADVVVADGSSVASKCFLKYLTDWILKIQYMTVTSVNI